MGATTDPRTIRRRSRADRSSATSATARSRSPTDPEAGASSGSRSPVTSPPGSPRAPDVADRTCVGSLITVTRSLSTTPRPRGTRSRSASAPGHGDVRIPATHVLAMILDVPDGPAKQVERLLLIRVPDRRQVLLADAGRLEIESGRDPLLEAGVGGPSVQARKGVGGVMVIAVRENVLVAWMSLSHSSDFNRKYQSRMFWSRPSTVNRGMSGPGGPTVRMFPIPRKETAEVRS